MAEATGSQLPSGYDEYLAIAIEFDSPCVICQLTLRNLFLHEAATDLAKNTLKSI